MLKYFPLTNFIGWFLLVILLTGCTAAADPASQATTAEASRASADERAKGDPNAPVTLIEYGDYQ